MTHPICNSCETVAHCSQHGCIPVQKLKPCRSPYCECTPGTCSHPGCYDARGEPWPPTATVKNNSNRRFDPPGLDPLYTTKPATPVQEPVGLVVEDDFSRQIVGTGKWHLLPNGTKLYTTPPAQPAPVQEPAFHGFMEEEECCVNICYTPWAPGGPNNELPTAYYTTPPAAQRPWVGLTPEEIRACIASNKYAFEIVQAAEAKLREKNT